LVLVRVKIRSIDIPSNKDKTKNQNAAQNIASGWGVLKELLTNISVITVIGL
jgi:hypothetical protein